MVRSIRPDDFATVEEARVALADREAIRKAEKDNKKYTAGKAAQERYCAKPGNMERKRTRAAQWHRDNPERSKEQSARVRESIKGRAGALLTGSRIRAKEAGLAFDLTREWVVSNLQSGKCSKTGRPFSYGTPDWRQRNPDAPSLDRIDPRRGYTMDNVQIVCCAYNIAKQQFTDGELLSLCEDIVRTALGG